MRLPDEARAQAPTRAQAPLSPQGARSRPTPAPGLGGAQLTCSHRTWPVLGTSSVSSAVPSLSCRPFARCPAGPVPGSSAPSSTLGRVSRGRAHTRLSGVRPGVDTLVRGWHSCSCSGHRPVEAPRPCTVSHVSGLVAADSGETRPSDLQLCYLGLPPKKSPAGGSSPSARPVSEFPRPPISLSTSGLSGVFKNRNFLA